jgi:GMP synthase-like glutamine amidotransferase
VKVLAVTHGPDVGPELLGDVVREEGHELVEWDITSAGTPTVDADAVIVLGGHQNVGEELEHPWLHEEYDALRRWVDAGTPLLGVCLGAQTLAHAAGARVAPAARRYGGFYETELTGAGAADPVLGALPRRFAALNANAYGFTVPPDGTPLARGAGLEQAFRIGERAWGVQFHPEVRRDQALRWFSKDRGLDKTYEQLAAEVDGGIDRWQELGRTLGEAFLLAAAG